MVQRREELRQILEKLRREVACEVQEKLHNIRTNPTRDQAKIVGFGELRTETRVQEDLQDDIEFALIQMETEVLEKIDEALSRLEDNTYGYCLECGEEISQQRLRALPFTVRCRNCQEAREAREEAEFRQRHNRRFLSW